MIPAASLLLACASALVAPAQALAFPPALESLDGAKQLMLKKSRVRVGTPLPFGEKIALEKGVTARIHFENGSQALFGAGSVFTLQENEIDLSQGEVRALVSPDRVDVAKKSAEEEEEEEEEDEEGEDEKKDKPAPPLQFKLVVKTAHAVVGVLGTDFVVRAGEKESSVHTLNGVVEVGAKDLAPGSGIAVKAGQFTRAFEGKAGINKPLAFSRGEFTKEFHARNPRLLLYWRHATNDLQTGRFSRRFEQTLASPQPSPTP